MQRRQQPALPGALARDADRFRSIERGRLEHAAQAFGHILAFGAKHTAHDEQHSAFRSVPRTGVIYVTTEATRAGFHPNDAEWCNLGQGQPETGALPGSPARVPEVTIDPNDLEYAPVAGIGELREAVAALYNRLYRRGMPSQYTAENVSISGGGRAASRQSLFEQYVTS